MSGGTVAAAAVAGWSATAWHSRHAWSPRCALPRSRRHAARPRRVAAARRRRPRLAARRPRDRGLPARRRRGRADVRPAPGPGRRGRPPDRRHAPTSTRPAACSCFDGEEHWLTGDLRPGERTVSRADRGRRARPRCCSTATPGGLEYHEPWHTGREISHLFRGRSTPPRSTPCWPSTGTATCASSTTASSTGARPALAGHDHVRGYHLIPAGASKAAAVAAPHAGPGTRSPTRRSASATRARTWPRADARRHASGSSPTPLDRDPTLRAAIAGRPNVASPRSPTAPASTRRWSRRSPSGAEQPSAVAPATPPRVLRVLRHPDFRYLWLAQAASFLGDRIVTIALALYVIGLTGSASDLGLVLAAQAAAARRAAPPRRRLGRSPARATA